MLFLFLFIHDLKRSAGIEEFFHFDLEVKILMAFDGLIIFNSISVEFDKVADDLFGRGLGEFELDLIV